MTDSDQLSQANAARLLLRRNESHDSLVTFARYAPIPSVPSIDSHDVTDKVLSVVETPLAEHHKLILETLDAMTARQLTYVIDFNGKPYSALPYSDSKTPLGGSFDGGVGSLKQYPHLSKFLQNYIKYDTISPRNGRETRDIRCSAKSSETTGKAHQPTVMQGSVTSSGDLIPEPLKLSTGTGSGESKSQESQELILSQHPKRSSDSSEKITKNKNLKKHTCLRVMLMLPPGSAKSTYASVVFPSWDMGRNPHHEIILTGYGDVICKRHGKRARQLCNTPAYRNVFNTALDPNTRAADEWQLTNGASYKSSGILSGITGFRCDGLIWDDLTKGRKEADSPTIRQDTWNAYIDDARSRKKPQAWEVGIGTRWHEDEIMGRVLPEGYAGESGYMECRDGNVWLVICIPAQAERVDDPLGREKGQYIWDEWFGEGFWRDKKVNARSWASLYQQRPAPDEGLFFKKAWFKRYTTLPENLNHYIGFDTAVTAEDDNANADDTVIQLWGIDPYARLYLIDEYCAKVEMDVWIDVLLDKVKKYKPIESVSESGVIRRACEPFLKRQMRKRRIFGLFQWMARSSNKPAMARPLQAMCSAGQVFVPENSIGDDFIDEHVRFPASKADNRVDAAANLCLRLEALWEANPPEEEKKEDSVIMGGAIPISQLMPPRYSKKRSRWSHRKTH